MMMKRWSLGMQLNKELLHSIPIWIRLPNLPLEYWTEEGISRIASVLGSLIRLDKFTEGITKISYARVLVEIKNSFKFPNKIPILTEADKMIWQEVSYEWKPSLCTNCSSFGHAEINCQFNKVWQPKIGNVTSNEDNSDMMIDVNGNTTENEVINSHNINETPPVSQKLSELSDQEKSKDINPLNTDITDTSQNQLEQAQLIHPNSADLKNITCSSSKIINKELQSSVQPMNVDTDVLFNNFSVECIDQSDKDRMPDSTEQNTTSFRASKSNNKRKIRTDETPSEFKASANSDVVDNPACHTMVNQLRGKNKNSKKAKLPGNATPLENTSNSEDKL